MEVAKWRNIFKNYTTMLPSVASGEKKVECQNGLG